MYRHTITLSLALALALALSIGTASADELRDYSPWKCPTSATELLAAYKTIEVLAPLGAARKHTREMIVGCFGRAEQWFHINRQQQTPDRGPHPYPDHP